MPFLTGSLGFERFNVTGFNETTFSDKHIEILEQFAAGQVETSSAENTHVGFLGGDHLFDLAFDLGKNLIGDALHCCVRVDTNQVPNPIRKAWLAMELAAATKDNPERRPTKTQRQEAKDAVEARCQQEAATGKYRRMAQFPVLWDLPNNVLYFGGSGQAAIGHCADLFERAFDLELAGRSAGSVALDWAQQTEQAVNIEQLIPAAFASEQSSPEASWSNPHSNRPDFLGNEFLLWLWWKTENESDTLILADDSEATIMLTKTLVLECPLGEYGKETIVHESPVHLPEAMQAVRSGKLPRKTGMTLVRFGQQVDLVLQAETFAISGAKIHLDEDDDPHDLDQRIESIRALSETVDMLFQLFCQQRVDASWSTTQSKISNWLNSSNLNVRKIVAA